MGFYTIVEAPGLRPAARRRAKGRGHAQRPPSAVDLNRLVATIGAVAIAYLFTRARIEKARTGGKQPA